jgi:hypothetical protein
MRQSSLSSNCLARTVDVVCYCVTHPAGDLYLNITSPDVEVQDIRLLNPVPPGAEDTAGAPSRSGVTRSPSMAAPAAATAATTGAAGCPPMREDAESEGAAADQQEEWLASPLPQR